MSDNDQSEDPEAPAPARETVAFVTPQAADASSTVAFVPTTVASPSAEMRMTVGGCNRT